MPLSRLWLIAILLALNSLPLGAQQPDSVTHGPITRTVVTDSAIEWRHRTVHLPPIPPPVIITAGIGIGPFNGTPGSLGTLFINANTPAGLKSQLANATSYGILGAPTGGSHAQYMVNGQWNLTAWKGKINAYRADSLIWKQYYRQGRLKGISLIDEPQCASCWGGRAVPWNTVSQAACYVKAIFPGVPVFTRSNARQIPAGTACLDGGILQFDQSMGNVRVWADAEIASAKAKGLILFVGVNAENGGKVVAGCQRSVTRPSQCRMSGAELTANFAELAKDPSVVCGRTLWVGRSDQWNSYTAVAAVRNAMNTLVAIGKTRPRPKRCGG